MPRPVDPKAEHRTFFRRLWKVMKRQPHMAVLCIAVSPDGECATLTNVEDCDKRREVLGMATAQLHELKRQHGEIPDA